MFVLACALCAAGTITAKAEDVTTASENGGKCSTGGAAFVDPLSAPHWNGWGIDPSQHRFQPSIMAQLAPDDVTAPQGEVGLRLPWRGPRIRTTDDRGRSIIRRQPERKSLFARFR
jgi:hypothetical protein